MHKKRKYVKRFMFRSTSEEGHLSKTYCYVTKEGTVAVNQLYLLENSELPFGCILLRKFKNKMLICTGMAFKHQSIMNVASASFQVFNQNKIENFKV